MKYTFQGRVTGWSFFLGGESCMWTMFPKYIIVILCISTVKKKSKLSQITWSSMQKSRFDCLLSGCSKLFKMLQKWWPNLKIAIMVFIYSDKIVWNIHIVWSIKKCNPPTSSDQLFHKLIKTNHLKSNLFVHILCNSSIVNLLHFWTPNSDLTLYSQFNSNYNS